MHSIQMSSSCLLYTSRMPSAVGYQPTLQTEMGALQERITSTKNGSITSVQAVYEMCIRDSKKSVYQIYLRK